jgi:hypothetical protein
MFVGLLGIGNDGKPLYAPSGGRICRAPNWLARLIQRIQHFVSVSVRKYSGG